MVKKPFQVTVPFEVKRTVLTEITADTMSTACTISFVETVKVTECCTYTALSSKKTAQILGEQQIANYQYRKFVTKLPKPQLQNYIRIVIFIAQKGWACRDLYVKYSVQYNVVLPVKETFVGLVLGTQPGSALPSRLHKDKLTISRSIPDHCSLPWEAAMIRN